ncbi:DUF6186 family protein [Microbacterium sp. ASV81]|uniref:DUF6186 family protein n=1 Tax=Microbacterium capsulatum TaxID=3041921 RepID=A0ABU0XPE3_9MICO|nr:DUF6186 family protein [Microbacterium sp. ASV81]MDQ4215630.1 DUF6186 family protein [Microbacterium sp. ASV81]
MTFVSIGFFALCAAVLMVMSRRLELRHPDATVTELFDRLLDDPAVRIAVVVIWWWLGWHFLAGATL